MSDSPPPTSVLEEFGVDQPVRPLSGGQGSSWLAGDVVLKPDASPVHAWFATIARTLVQDGFRLGLPLATREGAWSAHGWSATGWVAGEEPDHADPATWHTVIEAGRAFHRATRRLACPPVLSQRTDAWALADRAAWGEEPLSLRPELAAVVRRLAPLLRPALLPHEPSQVVHADLTCNVLVEPGLAPALIDVSPYWRPTAYAEGVVVADALCWHGADRSLLDSLGVGASAVARALLFRLFTSEQLLGCLDEDRADDEIERYERAATSLGV